MASKRFQRENGHAVVEIALMSPWILLLFIAVFNFGFYAYTLIAVENAARVAALHTSGDPLTADDSAFACFYALEELRTMANVGSGVTCSAGCAAGSACTAGPISVRAQRVNAGVDGEPASQVTVTYQGIQLFPLPFLMGKFDITRIVDMKI